MFIAIHKTIRPRYLAATNTKKITRPLQLSLDQSSKQDTLNQWWFNASVSVENGHPAILLTACCQANTRLTQFCFDVGPQSSSSAHQWVNVSCLLRTIRWFCHACHMHGNDPLPTTGREIILDPSIIKTSRFISHSRFWNCVQYPYITQ